MTSGAVKSATIRGQKGGYAVLACVGMQQRPLGTRTGAVRLFSTADTAIKLLRGLGVYHAKLDMTHYEAGSLRPARPDIARKNREANAALEHDRWFRDQVVSTKAKIERGEMRLIPHDEFWDGIEAYARELVAKRDVDNKAVKGKAPASRKAG
ncbi:MAG: hypothetical protein ACYCUX_04370 [Metallibacterium sp.]